MELYQIRYFIAVSETLNFTRAADRCFVSQPALTKAIQKLEELLGGRLFDRSRNAVHLTDLGRAMLPNFQQIYATANQTREQARRLLREQRPLVRAGVMCSVAFDLVLQGFLASQGPDASIDLQYREGSMEMLTDALDRNEIDLAVMAAPQEFPRRFRTVALFREDYVIAHGPAHRFAGSEQVSVRDLAGEPYCDRLNCEYTDYIDRELRTLGIEVDTVQASPREDWIEALVRAGVGIAYMPYSLALAGGVPHVHTPDCRFTRSIQAVMVADRPTSQGMEALLAALQSYPWPTLAKG